MEKSTVTTIERKLQGTLDKIIHMEIVTGYQKSVDQTRLMWCKILPIVLAKTQIC